MFYVLVAVVSASSLMVVLLRFMGAGEEGLRQVLSLEIYSRIMKARRKP